MPDLTNRESTQLSTTLPQGTPCQSSPFQRSKAQTPATKIGSTTNLAWSSIDEVNYPVNVPFPPAEVILGWLNLSSESSSDDLLSGTGILAALIHRGQALSPPYQRSHLPLQAHWYQTSREQKTARQMLLMNPGTLNLLSTIIERESEAEHCSTSHPFLESSFPTPIPDPHADLTHLLDYDSRRTGLEICRVKLSYVKMVPLFNSSPEQPRIVAWYTPSLAVGSIKLKLQLRPA
ncbi:hypothetical protein BT96DRAFT_937231 [Gymnopus androsaceus JB14]|uniref:Uncharacterized protein n=1 Tax=Gymnopus androsaceus JB14 TaxID=1447944 RepID=A0A6A4HW36_9AGAR|nr:hypothetical protein BT96DRAFT_937231 [Gymnopus androsaceus JB14]